MTGDSTIRRRDFRRAMVLESVSAEPDGYLTAIYDLGETLDGHAVEVGINRFRVFRGAHLC